MTRIDPQHVLNELKKLGEKNVMEFFGVSLDSEVAQNLINIKETFQSILTIYDIFKD